MRKEFDDEVVVANLQELEGYVLGTLARKTPWFSYSTPPKRKGYYECSCGKFHTWPGYSWTKFSGSNSDFKWRGLAQKAI